MSTTETEVWRVEYLTHDLCTIGLATDLRGALCCGSLGGHHATLDLYAKKNSASLSEPDLQASPSAAYRQVLEYLDGNREIFDLELRPMGSEFQRSCWDALVAIPFGHTKTYAEQSRMIGNPKAIRAVAQANNANPIPLVIPCHRVIGADGSLVGFGGGVELKQRLLRLEERQASLDFG